MTVRSHTFRGKRWRILPSTRNTIGICENQHTKNKSMRIPINGDTVGELGVIIHESLHACLWDLDEDSTIDTADDIARLLVRLGWRKE